MKKKRILGNTERKMISLLYHTKVPMTTYKLAKRVNVSYPTAKKYVTKLKKIDVFRTQIKNNKKKNYFNFDVLKTRK